MTKPKESSSGIHGRRSPEPVLNPEIPSPPDYWESEEKRLEKKTCEDCDENSGEETDSCACEASYDQFLDDKAQYEKEKKEFLARVEKIINNEQKRVKDLPFKNSSELAKRMSHSYLMEILDRLKARIREEMEKG